MQKNRVISSFFKNAYIFIFSRIVDFLVILSKFRHILPFFSYHFGLKNAVPPRTILIFSSNIEFFALYRMMWKLDWSKLEHFFKSPNKQILRHISSFPVNLGPKWQNWLQIRNRHVRFVLCESYHRIYWHFFFWPFWRLARRIIP